MSEYWWDLDQLKCFYRKNTGEKEVDLKKPMCMAFSYFYYTKLIFSFFFLNVFHSFFFFSSLFLLIFVLDSLAFFFLIYKKNAKMQNSSF